MPTPTTVHLVLPPWRRATRALYVCLLLSAPLLDRPLPGQVGGAPGASAAVVHPRPASRASAPIAARAGHLLSTYGLRPLTFELNQGQTDRRVAFVAHSAGATVFLSARDAILVLSPPPPAGAARPPSSVPWSPRAAPQAGAQPATTMLRLHLEEANPHPVLQGLDMLPGTTSYFLGSDPRRWRTHVPTYARVAYRQVYPGVDLIYHGAQNHLEYDFVVAPGARPQVIRLTLEGARNVRLDQQGNLPLRVGAVTIRQDRPIIYQSVGGRRHIIGCPRRRPSR